MKVFTYLELWTSILSVCACVCMLGLFTLGGLALSYEEGSPLVAMAQQLSLCILPPHLSKIPPVTMTTTHGSPQRQRTSCDLCPQTSCQCVCVCVCVFSLFGLYGVDRSYVVGGDVTWVACVQRASLPPVTLSAENTHKMSVCLQRNIRCVSENTVSSWFSTTLDGGFTLQSANYIFNNAKMKINNNSTV